MTSGEVNTLNSSFVSCSTTLGCLNSVTILYMNKQEWIQKYEPHREASGNIVIYDIIENLDFIQSQKEELVWTEIFDFDSDQSILVGGIILDEDGGLTFYVCDIPWSKGEIDIVEWDED